MADVTYMTVTGLWSHIVDDGIVDGDPNPDTVHPTGKVVFAPKPSNTGFVTAGAAGASESVTLAEVPGLVAAGVLTDLQGNEGVRLAATIGGNPVRWVAQPTLMWGKKTLPSKSVTFDPPAVGTTLHLNDLFDDIGPQSPLVTTEVKAYRDEAVAARDAAQQILDDVAEGVVPDAGVAARIIDPDSETRTALDTTYAPQLGKTFYVGQHGLVGDWTGGDANTGTGTNDTAALNALIASVPDGSTLIFDAAKTYRLDPISITGKSLTLDFNGASVVTKTMSSANLAVANPFITWTSTFGPEVALSSTTFARGAVEVVTNPFSGANSFTTDDLVILSDKYPVAKWDTGTNVSWAGYGEVNIVRSTTPSSGLVRLRVPLAHTYRVNGSDAPKLRKILNPVRPVVRNIGLLIDTNPGGLYTGSIEDGGAHIFHFNGCIDPLVENVVVRGWQNHICSFRACLRPRARRVEGRDPFQTGSGHGYIGRMMHCVDGEFEDDVSYGTRHLANYVASARCGSRRCKAYRPAGVSFQTHGHGSRDTYSIDDTVVGGDNSGWSHGNPQYGADYDFDIVRPTYYGEQNAILSRSGSTGTRVAAPKIRTSAKGVEVSALATDVTIDLSGGLVEIFGTNPSSYAVHAADVDSGGTSKPGSVLVIGPGTLTGSRAIIALDVTGNADVSGVRYGAGQAKVWDGAGWRTTAAQAAIGSATADLGTVLSDAGLRTAGGAYPISTSGPAAFSGGFRVGTSVRTAAATLTVTNGPHNLCNATAGAFTLTLPNTSTAGYRFLFKKIDASANAVTIAAGGSIDGATSVVLDAQYEWVEVMSNATSGVWSIVGRG